MSHPVHSVSWNLTQRCNLFCTHCYMSAFSGAETSQELETSDCFRVMDEMARINPNLFLILTGGEPLVRRDIFDIAAYGTDKGFTCVLGTNGVLLGREEAKKMRQSGLAGASISLDSVDAEKHDRFRKLAGSWRGALRGIDALKGEGLDFSLHMSVMAWNVDEIPAMIELAHRLGAKVLNFFFLVQTGRGQDIIDIAPDQYERILTYLARMQRADLSPELEAASPLQEKTAEDDPWTIPIGRSNGVMLRAKCAPHFRRILYQMDPHSQWLGNYAQGGCPAAKHYCRITPEGNITPCPYMPVVAGNLKQQSFDDIWNHSPILADLRTPTFGGRCGACEFSEICGGCRCRAYAVYGDYLAEDPACAYQPGSWGGVRVHLSEEQTFGLSVHLGLVWSNAAKARLDRLPSFARGMVSKSVERYAREHQITEITPELMQEVRSEAEKKSGRTFEFSQFARTTADTLPIA